MKSTRKLKKSDSSSKLVLEEIIGLTTKNGNGLASNSKTSNFVYVAGCVAVVHDVNSGHQSHLMVSHRTPKPLSCVAMSLNGRFVSAGESGTQSSVLVWDSATKALISELKGHLYGIACLAFSPDGKHLVSVGGYIYLWDWRSETLVTKLKASSSCSAVSSVCFSSDAKSIITAGKKQLKIWTIVSSPRNIVNMRTGSLAMHGNPVKLGLLQGSSFVSVTSAMVASKSVDGIFTIFALTETGVLCLVTFELLIRKSVTLKVKKGSSISASDKLVACACCYGIVQLFDAETLKDSGSLLYSKSNQCHADCGTLSQVNTTTNDFQSVHGIPDAVACQFSTSEKLVVIYSDHSLYIWDVHDVNQASRFCVLVSHSDCIWDVKNLYCQNMHDPSVACVARGCRGGISFATCSADGTIRLWDLTLPSDLRGDMKYNGQVETSHLVNAGILKSDVVEAGISTQGFRCMAVSSDGKYLAAGDCDGSIHIYDLQTSDYTCLQGAHEAEVLSLTFSIPRKKNNITEEDKCSQYYLASGSRDRVIHLFDVQRNFDLLGSMDDHSAAVTSVKFTGNGYEFISCSADRSLVFRELILNDHNIKVSCCHRQMASQGTVYDMAVDPKMEVVVTVGQVDELVTLQFVPTIEGRVQCASSCSWNANSHPTQVILYSQDKKINTFDIASGKRLRSFRQDKSFGDPIKIIMDPSCSYLICSNSNKSICMHDFITGDMVLQAWGHGEVVTGVVFSSDCKHIISIGGDGCIFVWKVPAAFSSRMLQKIKESSPRLSPQRMIQPISLSQISFCEEEDQQCVNNPDMDILTGNSNQLGQRMVNRSMDPQDISAFRFSISRLPRWAQAKVASSDCAAHQTVKTSCSWLASPSPQVEESAGNDLRHSISYINDSSAISSPDTSNTKDSQVPLEPRSCSAMDRQWLSIYTVWLDILSSPEIQKLMDTNKSMPLENSYLTSGSICDASSFGQENHVPDNEQISEELASSHNQLDSDVLKNEMQATEDFIACHVNSEDSDLFKQHFGSLSTMHKRSESATRRKCSSKYIMEKDCFGGAKRLFGTPVTAPDANASKCNIEPASHFKDMNNSLEMSPSKECNSSEKGTCSLLLDSTRCEPTEDRGKEYVSTSKHFQESMTTCREAIMRLDAAAENAIQLFSRFGSANSQEEALGEDGSKFYSEVAELLPSVVGKVNVLIKQVQQRNKDLCGSVMDVSVIEPLLGTFAENISQRVVEILKTNLSNV